MQAPEANLSRVGLIRTLWECFAPADAPVMAREGDAFLCGLQAKPWLNDTPVQLRRWNGQDQRFEVVALESGEGLQTKPTNLRPAGWVAIERAETLGRNLASRQFGEDSLLAHLPHHMLTCLAQWLPVRGVAFLSAMCHASREVLWRHADSGVLWGALLARRFGQEAAAAVVSVRPGILGPVQFRTARALRLLFRSCIEIVKGSVVEQVAGCAVVACPVSRDLENVTSVGAQSAIRAACAPQIEQEIAGLQRPFAEMSVKLVTGGDLCSRVALVSTEPPQDMVSDLRNLQTDQILEALVLFLIKVHANLFAALRAEGLRSVAMPTLCTGGIGLPVELVTIGMLRALREDFLQNRGDPLRVRVACYEAPHFPAANSVRDELYDDFYRPLEFQRRIISLMTP